MYRDELLSMTDKNKHIDSLINEEKNKTNVDIHKISRLEQSKLLNFVFGNSINVSNGKYRLPW